MNADPERERFALLVHELRSPVAALAAIAEEVRTDELDGESFRELARLALLACRSVDRIVRDAAPSSIRRERVDVRRLLEEARAAAVIEGSRVVVEPGSAVFLDADPVRLRQALDNLIGNARLHSGSAEDIVLSARREDDSVLLTVSDSGSGIGPSGLERIFDAGARLHDASEGQGLGLAVVRAVAEAHGGTVAVVSAPGTGSAFTIYLPLGR